MKYKNIILLFSSAFLLFGCQTTLIASGEDAYEVALDNASVHEEDVVDHSIDENGSKYKITFKTDSGTYEYTVGNDGIIQKRQYTPSTNTSSDKESSSSKDSSEEKKTSDTKDSTKEETTTANTLSDSDKQKALEAACNNMGISTSDANDVDIKLVNNEIEVRYNLGDAVTYVTIVDKTSFEATSSYSE